MDHLLEFPFEAKDVYETKLQNVDQEIAFVAGHDHFEVDDFYGITKDRLPDLLEHGPSAITRFGLSPDISEFLQSWLFFGLLSRVLWIRINVGIFIYNDSQYITTKPLPDLLDQWKVREDTMEETSEEKRRRHIGIDKALRDASQFVSKWYRDINSWGVKPNLWLSIAILGETLTRARLKILPTDGAGEWHDLNERRWGSSDFLKDNMKKKGWCPNTIQMLQLSLGSLSGLYVAQSLRPPDEKHKTCTIQKCTAYITNDMKFPLHSSSCRPAVNNCRDLRPQEADIAAIVRRGNIPLVFLDREPFTDDRGRKVLRECIGVREYRLLSGGASEPNIEPSPIEELTNQSSDENQMRYIAVSHVWSDGLGNARDNSLPQCRFMELQQMINEVARDGRRQKHGEATFFWLDTLCIPVSSELRKLGIRGMSKVYENSAKVLVLDQTLQEFDTNNGLEPLMRINMSKWARRLWTLQEGSLSGDLCFRFKDGRLLRVPDIEKRFMAANSNLHLSWTNAAQIFSPTIRSLRSRTSKNKVAYLWQAVNWRTSQKEEDETICLATLLDMDPGPLLDPKETVQEKMCRFISMLDVSIGIPPGMIFLPGPRLDKEGFRWAPKSWMIGQEEDHPKPLFLDSPPSFLTKRGLLVQYPGIRLHLPTLPIEDKFWFTTSIHLTQWYLVEYISENGMEHLERSPWSEIKREQSGSLAIILCRSEPRDVPEIALLVSVSTERNGVKWVSFLCRIWISAERRFGKIKDLCLNVTQRESSMIRGERLDHEQRWCVDKAKLDAKSTVERSTSSIPLGGRLQGAASRLPPPVPRKNPKLRNTKLGDTSFMSASIISKNLRRDSTVGQQQRPAIKVSLEHQVSWKETKQGIIE